MDVMKRVMAPALCGCFLTRLTAKLSERAIGRHEPDEHWHQQFPWIADRMSAASSLHFRVGAQIGVYGSRQLDRHPDSLVISKRINFELCHFNLDMVRARDRGLRAHAPESPA